MADRPILFSGPMVRALLAGTKTQTRRVVKPQFSADALPVEMPATDPAGGWVTPGHSGVWWCEAAANPDDVRRCPYGQPGDRLWVRETWTWHGGMMAPGDGYQELYLTYAADGSRHTIKAKGDEITPQQPPRREGEEYSLRDAPADFQYNGENTYVDRLTRWWRRKIPAIHMPRWASRITLEITGVRVERLQDISEADAIAEGVSPDAAGRPDDDGEAFWRIGAVRDDSFPIARYAALWEQINGPGSWDANPWVWVVEFKVVKP